MKHSYDFLQQLEDNSYSHGGKPGFVPAQQVRREVILRMPQTESEAWERQRKQHNAFWSKLGKVY